jgi:two-component system sensor kinase FixL
MENVETNKAMMPTVKLEPVFDAMLESMIVIDDKGIISQANKATTTMFGYSRHELVGTNIKVLMSGADKARHDRYIRRYEKTREKRIIGIGREVIGARKDGSTFPADIAVGEIKTGDHVQYVGLIRDLSEQRRTDEEALKQREEMVNVSRLSTMGEMAAAMAHELNQPLTAIANFAAASERLLEADAEGNLPIIREALQDIQEQAHRAGEVIRRTRTFTHSGDTEKQVTTLAAVFEQISSLAKLDNKANNIKLAVHLPEDLPAIEVDPVQIQQVMLNLIRNAVDAMSDTQPSDREISIRAKITAPHELRFEVRDHGSGIKAEEAKSIFNAFFTTKNSGMGMGLAICRTIIRKHGGELGFRHNDSQKPGSGTTFFFTLPTKVGG